MGSSLAALIAFGATGGPVRPVGAEAVDRAASQDAVPPPPGAPVLAWYYPQFSQGWAADVANAERAGIDALVVSQTTQLPGVSLFGAPIGQAARGSSVFLTLGIETSAVYEDQSSLVRELQRILAEEAPNPRFLRYQDRPVLAFWALPSVPRSPGQSPQDAWAAIRDQVDPGRASIWIGEGGDANPATGTLTYLPAFDGLHLYSIAWDADPGQALGGWARRVRSADPSKLWVATVMPGGIYQGGNRDRQAGEYFARAWQGAIATAPNMVILTSFNEAAEGSEIHPSDAWGDPNLYLDLNRQFGDGWRASVGAPPYGVAFAAA